MDEVGKRGRKGREVEKTGEKRAVQREGERGGERGRGCVRVRNPKQRDSKDKGEKRRRRMQ